MQEHIIISKDRSVNVPESIRKIGVQYDHNVNTLTFDCPRYSAGGVDLSTLIFYVNYLLPDNTPGSSRLENVTVDAEDSELIHFDWVIRRTVTSQEGFLKCLVCAKKSDTEGSETNHWNTDLFNTMYVTEGLETEAEIEEENKDLITQLLLEMDTTDENLLNLSNRVGELSNLTTDDKSSIVAAVNEVKGETTELKGDIAKVTKYPFTIDSRLYRSQYGTGQPIPKDSIIQLQLYCNSNTELFISDFYSTATMRRLVIQNGGDFACRFDATSEVKYEGKENIELKLMVGGVETEVVGYATIDWTNVSSGGVGYVKGDANILESCIIRTNELFARSEFPTELEKKIDKNGVSQVTAKNIDGSYSEYVDNDITERYQENNAWYATGSGAIGSVGSGQISPDSPTSRSVIDLRQYEGNLKVGFNSNVPMYGNNVFFIGDSIVSGATRITYFSKSNVLNNQYELFDTSHVASDSYVIVDLDKLKAKYPTAVGLFIVEPTPIWKLASLTQNAKKSLDWLKVNGFIPSIIVAKDGSGDYDSIQTAIDNATNGTTIYIKDGEHKETVIVNKYVHLVGQSKQNTILYQDIGNLHNCPLLITQGSVCNMTIKSLRPADVSGLTDYAYAIHLDKSFANDSKYRKCEIYNCDIISEVNDAIGAGTNYDEVFDVHDCFMYVKANPVKSGSCAFKCHIGSSQTGGSITLKNNTIIAEGSNGTSFYDVLLHDAGQTSAIKIPVTLINNVCKTFRNASTVYELTNYCGGNTVAEMNTI